MVGAEESLRIEAGAATRMVAAMNRGTPSASHATGIHSTQFCQFVYGKPGALFSVNRLSDAEAQATGSWRLSHRPSDGLEIQIQLICGSPTDGDATETGANFALPYGEGPTTAVLIEKWFSA